MNLVSQSRSRRRFAEMRLVRGVSRSVIEHRVNGRNQRLQPHEPGKNRAISDFAVKHESGALRHLQQMKIGCVRTDTRFHHGRTRTFEQLLDVDITSLRSNPGSNFPVAEMFSFAQTSVGQRKTYAVVPDPQIL